MFGVGREVIYSINIAGGIAVFRASLSPASVSNKDIPASASVLTLATKFSLKQQLKITLVT